MDKINLLNTNLGVSGLLPTVENNHLPKASDLSTSKTTDVKLDDLYKGANFLKAVDLRLNPSIGNDELLQPKNLNRNLTTSLEKLENIKDGNVRRFVREDLKPLMENKELLQSYLGMMVEG